MYKCSTGEYLLVYSRLFCNLQCLPLSSTKAFIVIIVNLITFDDIFHIIVDMIISITCLF